MLSELTPAAAQVTSFGLGEATQPGSGVTVVPVSWIVYVPADSVTVTSFALAVGGDEVEDVAGDAGVGRIRCGGRDEEGRDPCEERESFHAPDIGRSACELDERSSTRGGAAQAAPPPGRYCRAWLTPSAGIARRPRHAATTTAA